MDLYKGDAKHMVDQMRSALIRWSEVQQGGPARQELRKLSHQMRGSGRTYGFRQATRICKAMENIILKLEHNRLQADDRVQKSLQVKIDRLAAVFAA
jgi:chemotaxis protein histidine kinase CheA